MGESLPKYVRVTKSAQQWYWYVDKIGEVFEIDREDTIDYYLKGTGDLIGKTDCEPVIEHDGKFYREVERKAEVGELVNVVGSTHGNDGIFEVESVEDNGHIHFDTHYGRLPRGYTVLEPVEPAPSAGPTTQHEAIANLAVKVAELERKLTEVRLSCDSSDSHNESMYFRMEERLHGLENEFYEFKAKSNSPMIGVTELQIAILRADLPLDFRLDLIREAERLHNERLTKLAGLRGLDE